MSCAGSERPESWLDDSFNAGEVFPPDYSVFRNDRNTHGGGVALGIKCNLNPVLRPEFLSSNTRLALFYSLIIHCISFVYSSLPRPLFLIMWLETVI